MYISHQQHKINKVKTLCQYHGILLSNLIIFRKSDSIYSRNSCITWLHKNLTSHCIGVCNWSFSCCLRIGQIYVIDIYYHFGLTLFWLKQLLKEYSVLTLKAPSKFITYGILKLILLFFRKIWFSISWWFTWNVKPYFPWKITNNISKRHQLRLWLALKGLIQKTTKKHSSTYLYRFDPTYSICPTYLDNLMLSTLG